MSKVTFLLLCFTIASIPFSYAQNVGVGTSTPMSKLDVEGGVSVGSNYSGAVIAPTDGAIIEGAVGVGTSAPDASAQLQVLAANKGLLIPNVALTATNTTAPVTAPATSLLVYNTSTINDVIPGYYYWNGAVWARFDTGNNTGDWKLDGNTNGSVRSIGTNDNFDLPFETNGTERMRILANGNVGIGTTAPSSRLHILVPNDKNDNPSDNGLYVYNAGNAGDDDDAILSARVAGANAGDPFVSFDVSGVTGWSIGLDNSDGDKLKFANAWSNPGINTAMTIQTNGNVGIGNTAPAYKLHVMGDIYANGGWLRASGNAGFYCESYGGGWWMTDATWMRSYNDKAVYVNNVVRADAGFQVDGLQVIDADAGWHRTYGNTGWYNNTHGGGWFMQGGTWIEAYANKNVYTGNIMRADNGFDVGNNGTYFSVFSDGYTTHWHQATGNKVHFGVVSGENSIYPNTGNWGYCGYNPNYWYRVYANDVYTWNSVIWIIYDTYDDLALLNGIQTDTLWDPVLNHHVMNIRSSTIPKMITNYDEPNYDPKNPFVSQKRLTGFLLGAARQLDREGKARDTRLATRTDILAEAMDIDFHQAAEKGFSKRISEQGKGQGNGTTIKVNFSADFQQQLTAGVEPMISITPRSEYDTYYVSEVNQQGFTVVVKTAATDFYFNWLANATVHVDSKVGKDSYTDDVFHKESYEVKGDFPTLDYEAEKIQKQKMLEDNNANVFPNPEHERTYTPVQKQ